MGKSIGNYYELLKRRDLLKKREKELLLENDLLKKELSDERNKDINKIIAELRDEVSDLSSSLEKKGNYISGLKKKFEHLIRGGLVHYDVYKLVFDEDVKMDDISKLLIFGSETPKQRADKLSRLRTNLE